MVRCVSKGQIFGAPGMAAVQDLPGAARRRMAGMIGPLVIDPAGTEQKIPLREAMRIALERRRARRQRSPASNKRDTARKLERYRTDPEYRKQRIAASATWARRRRLSDPAFRASLLEYGRRYREARKERDSVPPGS